ncbi:TPA: transposase [Proteus mirabilis]|uniref:hypothetical protein n=1 Tax=Proteus mirabilis TaxID=584 RepID=UPI0029F1C10A|nr:transposase [Proteus mirabilis]HEK0728792.1 transposase [Proteus mirabilis]
MEYNPAIELLNEKRINKSYTTEFKQDAVIFVTEQAYSVPKAATSLGITDKITL